MKRLPFKPQAKCVSHGGHQGWFLTSWIVVCAAMAWTTQAQDLDELVESSLREGYSLMCPIESAPPRFDNLATNLTLTLGGSGSMGMSASSDLPVTYQWYHDLSALTGKTTATLSFTNIQYDQAGTYLLRATNLAGSTWSAPWFVSVVQLSAWGSNVYGQLTLPPSLSHVTSFASGRRHCIAATPDGRVVMWGTLTNSTFDTPPSWLNNVVSVAASDDYSVALTADGEATLWGNALWVRNSCIGGTSFENVQAISAAPLSVLLLYRNGHVGVINNKTSARVSLLSEPADVVAITSSSTHQLALRSDGTVAPVGETTLALRPPAGLSNVVAIAAGEGFSVALKNDGSIVQWGTTRLASPPDARFTKIAAGAYHVLGLTEYGQVLTWGVPTIFSRNPLSRIPNDLHHVAALTAGYTNSMALVAGREPAFVQSPVGGLVAQGTTLQLSASVVGQAPLCYAWLRNSQVIAGATNATLVMSNASASLAGRYQLIVSNALGTIKSLPIQVRVMPVIPTILAQPTNTLVLLSQPVRLKVEAVGSTPMFYQWKHNGYAMPGQTNATLLIPEVQTTHGGTYQVIVSNSAGLMYSKEFSLSVLPVAVWGATANYGQSNWPSDLPELRAAAAGSSHVVVATLDGRAIAWGNPDLQPPVPASATNVVGVAASQGHSLALRSDGTVIGWGDNNSGQTQPPEDLRGVVKVTAGFFHSMALKKDTTIAFWGYNGPTLPPMGPYVPPGLFNVLDIASGPEYGAVLMEGGDIHYWRSSGNAATIHPTNHTPVAIAATASIILSLNQDGSVVAFDVSTPNYCNGIPGVTNAVAIAGRNNGGVALLEDGTLKEWVYAIDAVPGPPHPVSVTNEYQHVASVSGGPYYYVAVLGGHLPTITIQPRSRFVPQGKDVMLHVRAAGDPPLSYQWLHDGITIPGATNSSLALVIQSAAEAGGYQAVVTNEHGSTTSETALMTLLPPKTMAVPQRFGSTWGLLIPVDSQKQYHLEWTEDLIKGHYTPQPSVKGNGGILWLKAPNPNLPQAFYRVIEDP